MSLCVLGLDTSSERSSAALVEDEVVSAEHRDARGHAEVLAQLITQVLQPSQRPDLIACAVGPGPYTGLRVGVTTAKVMGMAWGLPVVGVCSLDAIATAAAIPGRFIAASDARRKEVYWAQYLDGLRVDGPHVSSVAEIDPELRAVPWCGVGAVGYQQFLQHPVRAVTSDAVVVAQLARTWWQQGQRPSDVVVELSDHGHDSGATGLSLQARQLLPAQPLYVRKPDAVPTRAAVAP